jgi:ribosomal protein S18 acetylase RimI-like enzyme
MGGDLLPDMGENGMWQDVTNSDEAMQTYLDLRDSYGDMLMCDVGSEAMTRNLVLEKKRIIYVDVENQAFVILFVDRGGEISVCGQGMGKECLMIAEVTAFAFGFNLVHAWVREDNLLGLNLFRNNGYTEVCRKKRVGNEGIKDGFYFAKALR